MIRPASGPSCTTWVYRSVVSAQSQQAPGPERSGRAAFLVSIVWKLPCSNRNNVTGGLDWLGVKTSYRIGSNYLLEGVIARWLNVRFGSKAVPRCGNDVRFAPESGHFLSVANSQPRHGSP